MSRLLLHDEDAWISECARLARHALRWHELSHYQRHKIMIFDQSSLMLCQYFYFAFGTCCFCVVVCFTRALQRSHGPAFWTSLSDWRELARKKKACLHVIYSQPRKNFVLSYLLFLFTLFLLMHDIHLVNGPGEKREADWSFQSPERLACFIVVSYLFFFF